MDKRGPEEERVERVVKIDEYINIEDTEDTQDKAEDEMYTDKIRSVAEDTQFEIMEYIRKNGLCLGEYLKAEAINTFILRNMY